MHLIDCHSMLPKAMHPDEQRQQNFTTFLLKKKL